MKWVGSTTRADRDSVSRRQANPSGGIQAHRVAFSRSPLRPPQELCFPLQTPQYVGPVDLAEVGLVQQIEQSMKSHVRHLALLFVARSARRHQIVESQAPALRGR